MSNQIIYDLPMSAYRALPLLNKSTLNNWVPGKSPRQSLYTYDTSSLNEGRIIHDIIEGLGEITDNPAFVISEYDSFRTKEAKAWKDEQTKDIIKPSDVERYADVYCRVLEECSLLGLDITSGKHEVTVTTDAEKARIDFVPDNADFGLCDWKSIQSANPRSCFQAIDTYNYDMQAWMYRKVYSEVTGEYYDAPFTFIFFELKEPYNVTVIKMTDSAMNVGRAKYEQAVARHLKVPATAGYTDSVLSYEPPRWTLDKFGIEDNPFK